MLLEYLRPKSHGTSGPYASSRASGLSRPSRDSGILLVNLASRAFCGRWQVRQLSVTPHTIPKLPRVDTMGYVAANINVDIPRNSIVLSYLTRPHRDRVPLPTVLRPEEVDDPYMRLGAHPEVVQRIWDELGEGLPRDCRRVVYSSPALVHPENGTIFVLALGTGYGLRLPLL